MPLEPGQAPHPPCCTTLPPLRAACVGGMGCATPLPPRRRRERASSPSSPPAAPRPSLDVPQTIFSKAVVVPGQAIVPPCMIPETVEFQGITIPAG